MTTFALLVASLSFGGMALYSFAFATFFFAALAADTASALIRKAFAPFYIFVLITIAISAAILTFISINTVFAQQVLMPMIKQQKTRNKNNASTSCTLRPLF
jgi:hypothetical protein